MNESSSQDFFYYLNQITTRLDALERAYINLQNNLNNSDGGLSLNNSESKENNLVDDSRKRNNSLFPVDDDKDEYGNGTIMRQHIIGISNITNEQFKPAETSEVHVPKLLAIPNCFMGNSRHWLYNSLWIVVNVICIVISFIYIKNSYKNWQSSPVVQAISNNQVHFDKVAFPAVTICWTNTINDEFEFDESIEKCVDCENNECDFKNNSCSYKEMATMALAYLMCPKYASQNTLPEHLYDNLPHAINGNEFNEYMDQLFPACDSDVFVMQKEHGTKKKYTRCDVDFQQFYTSNSKRLCTTYNGLRREDIFKENVVTPIILENKSANLTYASSSWTFDSMMEYKGGLETVPIYGLEAIYILLKKNVRRYANTCSLTGMDLNSVIVHSPNEIPLDYDNEIEYLIGENTLLDLFVVPTITLARDDLAQYPPQQRGCLFTHERNLTMFKFYTKKNCEVECIIEAFLQTCGCIPYMYPRHNDSVKVCLRPCPRPKYRCGCLPDCNSLTYDIITQDSVIPPLSNHTPRALVEVMLWGNKYYTKVRYSISSYAEFIAYSLGVLGVFCGFSVKCMWEVLYFWTLGLWASVRLSWNKAISPSPHV